MDMIQELVGAFEGPSSHAKSPPGTYCERLEANRPTGRRPPSVRAWLFSVMLAAIVVLFATLAIAATAYSQTPLSALRTVNDSRPVLYLFSAPICAPCIALERELKEPTGNLKRYDSIYRIIKVDSSIQSPENVAATNAFLQAVPLRSKLVDLDGAGVRQARPSRGISSVPVLWIDGRSDYWSGYTRRTVNDLAAYLDSSVPISPVGDLFSQPTINESDPANESGFPTPVYESPPVKLEPVPDPLFSNPEQVEQVDQVAEPTIAPPDPDFEGVTVVVLVAALSEGNEELRAELARRANSALQQLARNYIGDRVDAYLVSEVGDKETYERLVATIGVRPGVGTSKRVAALVLIPERFDGLSGFLVGKLQQVLADHYLPDLKRAGVMPILERVHGETFDAVLNSLRDAGGGTPPGNKPLIFLVATYLSERSKLAEWLARRLGFIV